MSIEKTDILKNVFDHVYGQFYSKESIDELTKLGPKGYDWQNRVKNTIDIFLPRLVEVAQDLQNGCVLPFNCSIDLDRAIKSSFPEKVLDHLAGSDKEIAVQYEEWLNQCRKSSSLMAISVENLQSQQISAEVQRYLLADKKF